MNNIVLKGKELNYGLLTQEYVADAAKCFTDSFQREPMVKALNIPFKDFYDFAIGVCESACLSQTAAIAIEPVSNKVVGISVIQDALEEEEIDNIPVGLDMIFSVLGSLQQRYIEENEIKEKGKVAVAFSLGVDKDFLGIGIAHLVFEQTIKQAVSLGYSKMIGEASSINSQSLLGDKFGFKGIYSIRYKDFEYKGEKIFEKFPEGVNPTCLLMEKIL